MRIPYIIWSQCNTCSLKILISVLEWSDKCIHFRQCHRSNMKPSASNGPKNPAHGCCYLFRGAREAAELQKNSGLLYFVWSPPWHLYIFLLANFLAFYLAYLLAFYLAYLLAFYPAYLLAFYRAYLLAFYLTYLLAFYLAYFLPYLLAFYLAYLFGISSSISSGISSGILSGISIWHLF